LIDGLIQQILKADGFTVDKAACQWACVEGWGSCQLR